jgi:3-isopropylmalate/(R)-2-methylmalate dehydratase large subunit
MINAKTLFDKIWDKHSVGSRSDGKHLLYIDRHVIHELHVPHAFKRLDQSGRPIRRKDLTVIVQDHTVPTKPGLELISDHIRITREYANKYQLKLIDVASKEHGIVHIVSSEMGFAMPGFTLATPDSHASTVGALGCLAFGCGTTELEHILATQVMVIDKPKQMQVVFKGKLGSGVGAKDLALHLIRKLGVNAGKGFAVEFSGEVVSEMGIESRMTLCNMSIEWGARTCLIAPDEKTLDWCRTRPYTPHKNELSMAVKYWDELKSDEGAHFDKIIEIDCSELSPQLTWGTDPSQCIGIDEIVPDPKTLQAGDEQLAIKALTYMQVPPGIKIKGLKIDRVFIGSCSNSRISDLRAAAKILENRKVASHVKAIVVPGSSQIKAQAEAEGLDQVFINSGFAWHNSGCSMCAGANGDIGLPGERCLSTTNRNFENRQGRGVKTHLVSPQMAAAAALAGCIVDVRDYL